MPIQITMPALSPTMENGKIVKWHVAEGDQVEVGDILVDIETDKATMEVESIDCGKIAKILHPEGSTKIKVNSIIAYMVEEGEIFDESTFSLNQEISEKKSLPEAKEINNLKLVKKEEKSNVVNLQNQKKLIFSSPLARRLASQNSLDLSKISGSGPNGRIVKRDIEFYLENQKTNGSSLQFSFDVDKNDEQILLLYDSQNYKIKPHDNIRKIIAKRLTESKRDTPHFYVSMDCQLDQLLRLRQDLNNNLKMRYNPDEEKDYKISVNDMMIKAIAISLKKTPEANVGWLESGILEHKHVDVSVAVSSENGLITPILRQADDKNLFDLSKEAKDLILRAREKKLKPLEYQGGTTSISNMGMFNVKNFSAILNPPQATIFAIGASQKIPFVVENEITIGQILTITLSVDHRVIDGSLAAHLLNTLKNTIENPLLLLS